MGLPVGLLFAVVTSVAIAQYAHSDDIPSYPYTAPPARQRQIREGFQRIKQGDSATEVKSILGEPDEIRPLFEPKKNRPKRIGTTFWYYLEKPWKDKLLNVKVVRVSLDLGGKVMRVDHWGFTDGNGGR